jgi:hypothetical protein
VPRRKGPEAERAATGARESHWRYLLRNPGFRDDINDLLKLYDLIDAEGHRQQAAPSGDAEAQTTATEAGPGGLRARFGLPPLSDAARRALNLKGDARRLEEKLRDVTASLGFAFPVWELRRGRAERRINSKPPFPKLTNETVAEYEKILGEAGPPVTAIEDYDGETHLTPQELGDPRTLYLAVDLAYPQDVLVALMEDELRKAIDRRHQFLATRSGRRRPDKVDFYLQVYDRAHEGQSFGTIAKTLGKSGSTVRTAFAVAARNIFGPREPPSKREVVTAGFKAEGHIEKCPVCKLATIPEQFCLPMRRDLGMDRAERPWRETLSADPHREAADPDSLEDERHAIRRLPSESRRSPRRPRDSR